jgi:hypothetical protein
VCVKIDESKSLWASGRGTREDMRQGARGDGMKQGTGEKGSKTRGMPEEAHSQDSSGKKEEIRGTFAIATGAAVGAPASVSFAGVGSAVGCTVGWRKGTGREVRQTTKEKRGREVERKLCRKVQR